MEHELMHTVWAVAYSIPDRNLHSAKDPSTFLVVLSYRWSTRRCRGLRPAGIEESAPGVPAHPEGPLSRLLRSSRRLEVEVKAWLETDTAASFGRKALKTRSQRQRRSRSRSQKELGWPRGRRRYWRQSRGASKRRSGGRPRRGGSSSPQSRRGWLGRQRGRAGGLTDLGI